jgi:WD40 repeat protein
VYTWSLASYARTRTLEGHGGSVCTVRLVGGVLVSGGNDDRVKVWRLAEGGGECVATLQHEASVYGVAVLPSGGVAAVANNYVGGGLLAWRPA